MPYALITSLAAAVLGGPCSVAAVRPVTHDALNPAAPVLSLLEFNDRESNKEKLGEDQGNLAGQRRKSEKEASEQVAKEMHAERSKEQLDVDKTKHDPAQAAFADSRGKLGIAQSMLEVDQRTSRDGPGSPAGRGKQLQEQMATAEKARIQLREGYTWLARAKKLLGNLTDGKSKVEKDSNEAMRGQNLSVLCPWLDGPHHTPYKEPLCSNGVYSWTCFLGYNGTRVKCPQIFPVMCEDKCFSGTEYCCEKTESDCKSGRRKCEEEKTEQVTDVDGGAATSAPSTTAGNVEEESAATSAPSTPTGNVEDVATSYFPPETFIASTKADVEDDVTTKAGPAELTSSTAAGTEEPFDPNVKGEATTKAGPVGDVSSTGDGTKDITTTAGSAASTPSATAADATTQQANATEIPDCAEVAPSTFPGGCDLNVSGFACYALKNLEMVMKNGRMELEVHWACSPDKDQKGFTNNSCRALNWTYDATVGGRQVFNFEATPGIYNGICEFRTAEPISTTTALEAGSTKQCCTADGGTSLKATTSLSMVDGNDGNAPDQTTKAAADSSPDQTTGAPPEEETNVSRLSDQDQQSGEVPNSTTNSTRSGGSRPRGTGTYLSACLWYCASFGILRSMQ